MASIAVAPLSKHLDDDDLVAVTAALAESNITLEHDEDADPRIIERDLDEDLLAEFFDQLDANDAACDIYVPVEFEDVVEWGDYRIGSVQALQMVMDDIRDELFAGEEPPDPDDDDDDDHHDDGFDDDDFNAGGSPPPGQFATDMAEDPSQLKDDAMRHLWQSMMKGARVSLREGLCLFVKR